MYKALGSITSTHTHTHTHTHTQTPKNKKLGARKPKYLSFVWQALRRKVDNLNIFHKQPYMHYHPGEKKNLDA
jgi:hypothetical protein